MPKTKISEFSATANSNTDINSINIAEGCAPSNINDAIRELMAELKDFQAGTKGDSFNGPVGTTTASAGAFTTLSASSTVSGTGFSTYLASPPAIGGTAPAAGAFTTLSSTGNTTLGDASGDTVTINGTATFANVNPTLSAGTANGVLYLNGSKVATSGSALTFDGKDLGVGNSRVSYGANISGITLDNTGANQNIIWRVNSVTQASAFTNGTSGFIFGTETNVPLQFQINGSEQMRLTSTGLGIGTSSPGGKLEVYAGASGATAFSNGANFIVQSGTAVGMSLLSPDANACRIYFGTASNNRNAFIYSDYNSGSQTLIFGVGSSTTAATEKMRLDSSGNLGIGTSSPSTKLHIKDSTGTAVNLLRLETPYSNPSGNKSIIWTDATDAIGRISISYTAAGGSQMSFGSLYSGGYQTSDLMVLNSSGNLGLGVTPSAWGIGKALQINNASMMGYLNRLYANANTYFDGTGTGKYIATDYATSYQQVNGQHLWLTAASGTAGNAISFTQAMTLDASGRLGIGVTAPLVGLDVRGTSNTAASTIQIVGNTVSSLLLGQNADGGVIRGQGGNNALTFWTGGSGDTGAGQSGTERARITSGGKLGLNTTSPSGLLTVYTTTAADFTSQANLENSSLITLNSTQATSVVTFQGGSGNPDKFIAVDNFGGIQYFSLGYQNGATRRNVIQFDQNDTIYFSTAGSERARIDSSGNLLVGTTAANAGSRLRVKTSGTTNATYGIFVANNANAEMFSIEDDGRWCTGATTTSPYNNTTATAANMVVTSGGFLQRSTSSLKYKKNVVDAVHGLSDLMKLRSVIYEGKAESDSGKTFGGLIAEEVDAAGLTEFVQYAEDGSPDALAYGNMVSLCIKAIQEQQAIIEQLTSRIAALETK